MQLTQLVRQLRSQFRLDWHGIHGVPHWARVMYHGVSMAPLTGADADVVRLFAVLHDSQRQHDGSDRHHGSRAADYARRLHRQGLLSLSVEQMELLVFACQGHSNGHLDAHPTVQTCWDADRLDLGRVGIRPDPRYLCTKVACDAARIEHAYHWSRPQKN